MRGDESKGGTCATLGLGGELSITIFKLGTFGDGPSWFGRWDGA